MKNLLLIDYAVRDYQTFVESVNEDTIPFVYTLATTREELLTFIGLNTIERMALVSHETQRFLGKPFYAESNFTFFVDTIRQCQIKNLDFLACDTLNNLLWKSFYDNLHTETGVLVGASDNQTGNLKYGGDWILESTCEDIELIYFTSTIQYYKYILANNVNFTMIVKTDGQIWGAGYNGQLNLANGDYTYTDQPSFINVTAMQSAEFQLKTVKLLKCGNNFTFALMTDGTLWGAGDYDIVGTTPADNKFAEVTTLGTIVSLDCGYSHTVLYTRENKLWGVGNNDYGQLGLGESTPNYETFTEITGIVGTIKAVACGGFHTVVLTTANKLWVTGANFNSLLGLGVGDTTTRFVFTKIDIDTLSGKIPDIIAGGYDTIFVSMTDGTIWKPSSGVFAQVSNTNNYYNGLRKPIKFECLYYYLFVLMSDGTLWGIGDGDMLGPNVTGYNSDFRQMTPPTTIKSIFGGMRYSMVLGTNNTLYATGFNQYGEFGNGSVPSNIVSDPYVISTTDVSLLQGDALPPSISSFTPSSGTRNTVVTITGSGFGNVTSVLFGTVAAINPIISSTTIIVNAPINIRSVPLTLVTSQNSVISSTNFTYNTNPTLFTSTISDVANNLLSQLSLIDGIADTGILRIGSVLTTTNLSGTTYGVTVSSSDNSSTLATTSFVKAQNYATQPTLASYAQNIVAQTWSAVQTFSNGILSSNYNALTPTSTVSVGSNLTTGTLNLGTSTSSTTLSGTSVTMNNPIIMNPVTIGYNTMSQVQPVRGLMNRQFGLTNTSASTFTSATGGSIQAVINGLPNGRYLLLAYVYLPYGAAAQRVDQRFGFRNTALSNGLTTGYSLLGDGIGEVFGYKANNASHYSSNVCQVVDITNGNGNVGVWVSTGTTSSNTYATLNMMRIS